MSLYFPLPIVLLSPFYISVVHYHTIGYRVDHPITAATTQEQVDFLTVHQPERLGHISAEAIRVRALVRANVATELQSIDFPPATRANALRQHAKSSASRQLHLQYGSGFRR
jgi:hypothetical protein